MKLLVAQLLITGFGLNMLGFALVSRGLEWYAVPVFLIALYCFAKAGRIQNEI
jgi:hypothetical protein